MRRNRILFVLVLFVLSIVSCFAQQVPLWVEPAGSHRTGQAYPLPTAEAPTYGFLTVATPTFAVGTSTAVAIGTLPSNTHLVEIYAYGGDVNYGPSTVAMGTSRHSIASGAYKAIAVATTTPTIYVIGRTGAANVTLNAR